MLKYLHMHNTLRVQPTVPKSIHSMQAPITGSCLFKIAGTPFDRSGKACNPPLLLPVTPPHMAVPLSSLTPWLRFVLMLLQQSRP